jgi:hypothetical protein
MKEKEREIDYLSRLSVHPRCTLKTTTEVQRILVDFIMRNNLDLNGQTGKRYVTFREHGFEESFIGGFGSRHQIAHLIIDQAFNIKDHAATTFINIVKLYEKIDIEALLTEECVTFSLKEGYTKLEDVEYVEFVYNACISNDKWHYPESKILVRHYLDGAEPSFSMVDREDIDMDLIITLTTSLTRFNDILPPFIEIHKEAFCEKLGIDSTDFSDDTNMLIQMVDV